MASIIKFIKIKTFVGLFSNNKIIKLSSTWFYIIWALCCFKYYFVPHLPSIIQISEHNIFWFYMQWKYNWKYNNNVLEREKRREEKRRGELWLSCIRATMNVTQTLIDVIKYGFISSSKSIPFFFFFFFFFLCPLSLS